MPGQHARPGRHVDGLDQSIPAHGQRGRRAAAGMPGGAPAGGGRHRPDDPDAARGGDGRRGRAGGRPRQPPDRCARGGPAGQGLEAERAAGEMVHEDCERAVAARVPPPRRDQVVLQLPVGHEHLAVGVGDRCRAEPDRLAARLGDHGDAGQRAGQADGQPAAPRRGRTEPARGAAGRPQPDLGAGGRVLPGVGVRHLEPRDPERLGEVPGGLLVRGDVTPAGARLPGDAADPPAAVAR